MPQPCAFMDLRRIRHFTVLAQTLNFSRAAERLHIAQPALSVSIQKLEAELGTRPFERTPAGVLLTASGAAALVEARRLLHHGEQLMRTSRDAAAGTSGRLRIGFVGSAIHRLIPMLIPSFRQQYPNFELVLTEATTVRILAMLNEEPWILVLFVRRCCNRTVPRCTPMQRDRFLAALPAAHRLASRKSLQLADLAGEPFVMYSQAGATGLHASAMGACEAAGFVPEVTQEANQVATPLALVESGLGVALVPEVVRGQREPQIAYRDLADARGRASRRPSPWPTWPEARAQPHNASSR